MLPAPFHNPRFVRLQVMASSPEENVDIKELSEKQQLVRSQVLRQHAGFVPESAFLQRRNFFAAKVRCRMPYGPTSSS